MRRKGGEYIPHKLVDSSEGRKRRGLHQDRGITQLPPGIDDEDAPDGDPDLGEGGRCGIDVGWGPRPGRGTEMWDRCGMSSRVFMWAHC